MRLNPKNHLNTENKNPVLIKRLDNDVNGPNPLNTLHFCRTPALILDLFKPLRFTEQMLRHDALCMLDSTLGVESIQS